MSRNDRVFRGLQHIYMFLFALRFQEAFWVIYLRSRGFSFAAIGMMETVYHVAGFFAEIPTGIIADRISRKHSLLFGRAAAIAASLLVLYSRNLPLLIVAFAVWSLGGAFHSGAYEALVYDGLLEKSEGSTFTRVWGRLNGTFLACFFRALWALRLQRLHFTGKAICSRPVSLSGSSAS